MLMDDDTNGNDCIIQHVYFPTIKHYTKTASFLWCKISSSLSGTKSSSHKRLGINEPRYY